MTHAQKPDFVFRRNGRVHLNRRGRQFSRLLAAEVFASAVVMLDTPCSEAVWRVLATHTIRQFPLHFPSRASPGAITFQTQSTTQNLTTDNQLLKHYIIGHTPDTGKSTTTVILSQTFRETPPATLQFWDIVPSVTPNVSQLSGLPEQPVMLNSPKKAPHNTHAILTSIWVVKHAVQDSAPDAWTADFRSWIGWLQRMSTPV